MTKKGILFGVSALLAAFSMGAEAKYYKWVDKDGRVHYETTMQPEDASQRPVEMSQGREVKKQEKEKDAGKTAPKAMTPGEVEQERHDQALLGTFSSEAEIDLARDRNLQQVNARISSIQMRLNTAQTDLDEDEKEKAALQKAGKPVDKPLQEQIDQHKAKLAKLQSDMAQAQAEAADIKARYEADKKRFHELKSGAGK